MTRKATPLPDGYKRPPPPPKIEKTTVGSFYTPEEVKKLITEGANEKSMRFKIMTNGKVFIVDRGEGKYENGEPRPPRMPGANASSLREGEYKTYDDAEKFIRKTYGTSARRTKQPNKRNINQNKGALI